MVIIVDQPAVRSQSIGVQRGVGDSGGVLAEVCQHPGQCGLVVLNHARLKAKEKYDARVLLVLGDIEGVDVGVRAEAPQLEVHLLLVLAGAGVGGGLPVHHALPVSPLLPHRHEECAVSFVAFTQLGDVVIVAVDLLASVIISPYPFLFIVTKRGKH